MTTQYIGARYVPIVLGEYDPAIPYEALSIVTYNNNSYTSKKPVPAGVLPTVDAYWALTGSYNAQIEQYRQEVELLRDEITTLHSNGNYYVELKHEATLDLPAGHTTQGMCIYNGYIYVFSHINDTSGNTISKYRESDFTLVDTLSLPNDMHGNGLTVNPATNTLIVCNSWSYGTTAANAGTLIFVPLNTFNSYTIYDYRNTTGTSISAVAVSPDGLYAAETVTGSSNILFGMPQDNVFTPFASVTEEYVGGTERQDMALSNDFMYVLHTNVKQKTTSNNYVDVLHMFGTSYGRLFFDKDLDELEGISCNDDEHLVIVDVNGKVYTANIGDIVIKNSLSFLGFRSFAGHFGYYVNTQVCKNSLITIETLSNGATIQTRIPVPPQLISSYMLAYISGTALVSNNKSAAYVTATGGLRLIGSISMIQGTAKLLYANYSYSNGYWNLDFVQIGDDRIAAGSLEDLVALGISGETGLFGFGEKFTFRGYPLVGLKLND